MKDAERDSDRRTGRWHRKLEVERGQEFASVAWRLVERSCNGDTKKTGKNFSEEELRESSTALEGRTQRTPAEWTGMRVMGEGKKKRSKQKRLQTSLATDSTELPHEERQKEEEGRGDGAPRRRREEASSRCVQKERASRECSLSLSFHLLSLHKRSLEADVETVKVLSRCLQDDTRKTEKSLALSGNATRQYHEVRGSREKRRKKNVRPLLYGFPENLPETQAGSFVFSIRHAPGRPARRGACKRSSFLSPGNRPALLNQKNGNAGRIAVYKRTRTVESVRGERVGREQTESLLKIGKDAAVATRGQRVMTIDALQGQEAHCVMWKKGRRFFGRFPACGFVWLHGHFFVLSFCQSRLLF